MFSVKAGKAQFQKVGTGITGATDIEVLSGLGESDQIVTGSYKVIRSLRNEARDKRDYQVAGSAESYTNTQGRHSTTGMA